MQSARTPGAQSSLKVTALTKQGCAALSHSCKFVGFTGTGKSFVLVAAVSAFARKWCAPATSGANNVGTEAAPPKSAATRTARGCMAGASFRADTLEPNDGLSK